MRCWPVREPAQQAYERLREASLRGLPLLGQDAARFQRGGLGMLILQPAASSVFVATLLGVPRPPWSPYSDPRLDTLAEAYGLLTSGLLGRRDEMEQAR